MFFRFKIFRIIFVAVSLLLWVGNAFSEPVESDTLVQHADRNAKYDSFYDSLKSKAEHKKLTKLLHHAIFRRPGNTEKNKNAEKTDSVFEGKIIGQINIIRLDVFGPSLSDTCRKATLWYEKAGNFVHTRSDLNNIRKNLILKKGDVLKISEIYENERLLRALPYLKDVRFYVKTDSLDTTRVNITLLTQDRFSIGATGDVNGFNAADFEIYNRNIFGIGHELSARFVGHLTRQPLLGIETFYKINNLYGRFISVTAGYSNTYRKEGAMLILNKPFLRVSDTWGYGISDYYYGSTNELPGDINLTNPVTLGYYQFGGWAGRNLQLGDGPSHSQLTVSGQFTHRTFTDRPQPLPNGEQYFQNTNLYLVGFTWSKRTFMTDELIYSYGITEDIPKGFKNEWVIGFDDNEFGKRCYSHIFLANANLFPKKPDYFYLAASFSSFFKSGKIEQGLIEFSSDYISRLFSRGNARFREFINLNYRLGINRLETEKLLFEKNNLIRGFESNEVSGNQRLSIEAETVYFQKRDFYRFNLAFFAFADLGIMNSEKTWIFRGDYYSGLGIGLRLHNESLVLKTLQIRLAFYPYHPKDVSFLGFQVNEQNQQYFYSFQPEPPAPRKYE